MNLTRKVKQFRLRLRQKIARLKGSIRLNDVVIPIDESIISPPILQAMCNGTYEGKESKEIGRIIQPGERVLEIGVGLGYVSTIILRNELVSISGINAIFSVNPL